MIEEMIQNDMQKAKERVALRKIKDNEEDSNIKDNDFLRLVLKKSLPVHIKI